MSGGSSVRPWSVFHERLIGFHVDMESWPSLAHKAFWYASLWQMHEPRNAEELVADADLADSVELQPEALSCIGDLIVSQPKNLDALASKVLGEEPQLGPALNSLLRIILRTSSMQEFVAADYVFKCFCEENPDGQAMLVSTLIPQPMPMAHAPPEEDVNMSLGSMLLQGLTLSENDGDLECLLQSC